MINPEKFKEVSWKIIHLKKMKHHEILFSKTESGMRRIIKIINYSRSDLPITFDHPL